MKNNTTILISQPEPTVEKSPYSDIEEAHKLSLKFIQLSVLEAVSSIEFRALRIHMNEFPGIIFTSRIGIDFYFQMLEELRLPIDQLRKYFCISETVAYYLQKYIVYRKRKVFIAQGTTESLAKLVARYKLGKYLLPTSAESPSQVLPKALKAKKVQFIEAPLYRAVCADLSKVDMHSFDMIALFSAMDVKSLLQSEPNFEQRDIVLAAMGQKTIQAVKDAGLTLHYEVPSPNTLSMPAAIMHFLKKK